MNCLKAQLHNGWLWSIHVNYWIEEALNLCKFSLDGRKELWIYVNANCLEHSHWFNTRFLFQYNANYYARHLNIVLYGQFWKVKFYYYSIKQARIKLTRKTVVVACMTLMHGWINDKKKCIIGNETGLKTWVCKFAFHVPF